jgi:hypothetical protein
MQRGLHSQAYGKSCWKNTRVGYYISFFIASLEKLKTEIDYVENRHAYHVTPYIRKSWH